jgi:hypothetical protein
MNFTDGSSNKNLVVLFTDDDDDHFLGTGWIGGRDPWLVEI